MLPTSTEIEYFIEVYQSKHISKSAIRLGVTQPTLTQSIQKLEEKLASPLFHRTKQGVVSTEAGNLFYKKANQLLDSWKELHLDLHSAKSEIQGQFKIGCHPCIGAYTLPVLMDRLQTHAPNIEIKLVHDISRVITEKVISFEIDLAFVANPVRHPDLVLRKIGTDQVTFWKKRGLQNPPKNIFVETQLKQVEAILTRLPKKYFDTWHFVQSTSLELIRTLVLSGQGIGILPERVAKADGADLVVFDKNLPVYQDEIYLIYRKDHLTSRAGKQLVEHCYQVL